MPDFKGRKDFPEVADAKIKIGDYSGSNRLAVTDIYSPKSEPELRDQIMEPVKGKTNNYDSPILSQQPVIVLSDMDAEAALMNAIDGYVAKQGSDAEDDFGPPKQKDPRESHPSRAHDEGASPRQRRKPRRNPQAKDYQKSDFEKLGPGGVPVANKPLKPAATGSFDAAPETKPAWGDAPKFDVNDPRDRRAGAKPAPQQNLAPKPPGTPVNVSGQLGGTSGASPGVGLGQGERKKRKGVGFLGRLGRGAARLGARGAGGVARFGAQGVEGVARMGADASGASGIARRFGQRRVIPQEMALADILNELETYIADQQPNNMRVEQQLTKGNFSKMMRNTEDKAPRDWKYHV